MGVGVADLGVAAESPQLLAGHRIVAADELGRVRDELGLAVDLRNVGVAHDGISSRAVRQTGSPSLTSKAAMNESFWMSHCTITRSLQMIGELADAPLVVGVVEPAGVQHAEVALPEQLAPRSYA